jgi:glycosyltransferase involved in cell wall biosynthesis|tara:strand:+ start:754 stop:1503 length:750 start_codon:yes stop_codon:yes gene_type:complete
MPLELSIIVPVYNERQNIELTVDKIIDCFSDQLNKMEILFIDDDSPDGTAKEILRISKKIKQVKLIRNGIKEGLGAAHKAGYEAASGEQILTIDADFSQLPEDLLNIKKKIDEGYDLVIGSRYMKDGSQIGKSFLKDLGSRFINYVCRYLLGIKLKDCTHGCRGFKKDVFEKIRDKLDTKGHPSFVIQFAFWSFAYKMKCLEVPISFKERSPSMGESKISIREEIPPFLSLTTRLVFTRIARRFNISNK